MVQRFGFSAARSVHSFIRDNCDRLFICATAPASYSAASNQPQMIVSANVTADEWSFSSGAQGPALTFNSRTLTIEGSGSASHLIFARSSGSTILALTDVCAGTVFASGNTVTTPAWRTEVVGGDTFLITLASQGQTVAAPGMFSPNALSLLGWYAPESSVTVTAGRVTQWNDKSGNGFHLTQTLLSAMPNHVSAVADFASRNCVGFVNGRSTGLVATNATAAVCAVMTSGLSPFSGALVLENSATTVQDVIVAIGNTPGGVQRRIATSGGHYVIREIGGITTAAEGGSAATTPAVLRWQWTSGRASAWHNGVQIIASAKVCAGGNNAPINTGQVHVGRTTDGFNEFQGHMAEFMYAATAWSSSQGRELDKLLGAKYGITIT
jgi:hypothetical protein